MAKRFTSEDFSSAILESWIDFQYSDIKITENDNNYRLSFKWNFKDYDGFGYIDFDSNHRVRNTFGDNYSYLTLSNTSREKHRTLKPTNSLYNDRKLEDVFQKILDEVFK